jgi:hypothetical protein
MGRLAMLRWWVGWVAITAGSGALALLMAGLVVTIMLSAQGERVARIEMSGDNAIGPALVWGCGLLLFVGPLVGIGQGVLIRMVSTNLQWQKWCWATILGAQASIFLLVVASFGCSPICGAAVPGIVLSLTQWLTLRDTVKHAYLWVIGNCAAWIFAVVLGPPLADRILPHLENDAPYTPFYPFEATVIFSLTGLVMIALFAAWTGALLIWMLNNGPPVREELAEAY